MTTEIEPGDMVQLRSGGPPMVILKLEERTAGCCFFDNDSRLHKEAFPVEALKKLEEETCEA